MDGLIDVPDGCQAGGNARVLLCGGVTGGHVMPCLTLARALVDRGHSVLYIGARRGLEAVMSRQAGLPFTGFRFVRNGRTHRWASLLAAMPLVLDAIERFRPHVTFAKGSQVSVPVVLAARDKGVPIVLHESDSVAGWENRVLAPLCTTFCAGHPELRPTLARPVVVTGNLTRPAFGGGCPERCRDRFGIPADRPLVFVTGGSQGAPALNELLAPILPDLTGRYFVLHQCGPGKLLRRTGLPGYLGVEFLGDELRDVYAASTLVVSRAGAGTITELRQYAVPAVRVPYPWARGNHQLENARLLARRGVCTVLLQDTLTPERLLRAIDEGVEMAPERRANYRDVLPSNALERIIAEVLAAASVRGNGRHDS